MSNGKSVESAQKEQQQLAQLYSALLPSYIVVQAIHSTMLGLGWWENAPINENSSLPAQKVQEKAATLTS